MLLGPQLWQKLPLPSTAPSSSTLTSPPWRLLLTFSGICSFALHLHSSADGHSLHLAQLCQLQHAHHVVGPRAGLTLAISRRVVPRRWSMRDAKVAPKTSMTYNAATSQKLSVTHVPLDKRSLSSQLHRQRPSARVRTTTPSARPSAYRKSIRAVFAVIELTNVVTTMAAWFLCSSAPGKRHSLFTSTSSAANPNSSKQPVARNGKKACKSSSASLKSSPGSSSPMSRGSTLATP